ncbi:unnamed protein product [Onchocerca flexuosa]|uniref:Uncharacterized protein n=1 Tax=Onchocerca flexuosa TaxID=387005 RepID=A0A183HQP1_9BILA|nr:unnamed protein product [Onchocerca flexuosa]
MLTLKYAFVIIHLTRYYQVVSIFTLQAANKQDKVVIFSKKKKTSDLLQELWIGKFQESIENYESIQLKDMLKCTPLYSSLSLRRCSSSRLIQVNTSTNQNSDDLKSSGSSSHLESLSENSRIDTEGQDCESTPVIATTKVHSPTSSSDIQTIRLDAEIV